jgi:hypothetical protein
VVQQSAAVALALESVAEVADADDPTPLANLTCADGGGVWTKTNASEVVRGVSQSFVYSCRLVLSSSNLSSSSSPVASSSASAAAALELELQFDLFDNTTVVSVADLANLTLTPALTKLSVRMRGAWPWSAAASRLEVRLAIRPTFSSALLVSSTEHSSSSPSRGIVTTWRLEGQAVEEKGLTRETTVELVDVVELDGTGLVGDQWVRAKLVGSSDSSSTSSSASSSLVLSFGRFNESLLYDPSTCLLSRRSGHCSYGV